MSEEKVFVASDEAKGKARQFRMFAILMWLVAIAGQVFAILKLISDETLVWLIVVMVVILGLAIGANMLWKKANKLDPASEKDKTRFFIQSQLGAIMGVLAFLPLVLVIFTNKDINGKTKGIAGVIAVVFMALAGITGVDFNPPSVEKYTKEINEQTDALKELNVEDNVHWTKAGNKYHIYQDCYHIEGRDSLYVGTVRRAFEQKGICELCKTCQKRAAKENVESSDQQAVEAEAGDEDGEGDRGGENEE